MQKTFSNEKEENYIKEIVRAYKKLLKFRESEISSDLKKEKKIYKNDILEKLNRIKNERTKFLLNEEMKMKKWNYKRILVRKSNILKTKKKQEKLELYYFDKKNSHEENKFVPRIIKKLINQDPWYKQISRLPLSKSTKIIAINSWKENSNSEIILHLRKKYIYLKSESKKNFLQRIISNDIGQQIKISIVEDDNYIHKTPYELYKNLYEEELIQIKKEIDKNKNLLILKDLFNIEINKDDIFLI